MNNVTVSVVTGANGFVGSHLVDLLLEKGDKVKCITRKSSNLRWLKGKDVEIVDCGLFDKEKLKDVLKDADYLYHVAGVVKSKKPEGYYEGNVTTTKNLLDALVEVNPNIKRVVIVSSQTAGGPSSLDKIKDENSPSIPITTYGKSKLAQENLAKQYMDKLPITITRAPAVYGERDTEIYLVFRTYQQGLMTLVGFDKKQVSLIHAADLVRGIYMAAHSEKAINQTYYITSKEFYNWEQVGKILKSIFKKKALSIKIPHPIVYTVAAFAQFFAMFSSKAATFNLEKARDFVQPRWTCSWKKAEEDFGFVQAISIEDGLKRTIDWYREMKWLK
jgi:nucleoside-diphosphate-sugar epimerase